MIDVPTVDLARCGDPDDLNALTAVAREVDRACRDVGFFSVIGHGIDPALPARLAALGLEFFARPDAEKDAVAMRRGGTAWRGWFPLHGELTSGTPDHKEGYYFGRELGPTDGRVRNELPLHGPNLFPREPEALGPTVLAYLDALEALGHRLTRVVSVALGLAPDALDTRWFRDPVILLRLFRYPPPAPGAPERGVGEHTDYGFLTLLWQDQSGGLEVRTDDGWQEVVPRPDGFVCNLGDMLERLTGGRYRSTAHRVRSPREGDRIAIPFFFDPDWDARVDTLLPAAGARAARWDDLDPHAFSGTYGEYLLTKVGRVFPDLRDAVIPGAD